MHAWSIIFVFFTFCTAATPTHIHTRINIEKEKLRIELMSVVHATACAFSSMCVLFMYICFSLDPFRFRLEIQCVYNFIEGEHKKEKKKTSEE